MSTAMLPKPLVAASLRPIMLSLLAERAQYGYEIIQRVEKLSDGKLRWSASKLYPLLHSLENEGLVEPFWRPSDSGPDRKYYQLTEKGHRVLEVTKQHWLDLNAVFVKLWGPDIALSPSAAS